MRSDTRLETTIQRNPPVERRGDTWDTLHGQLVDGSTENTRKTCRIAEDNTVLRRVLSVIRPGYMQINYIPIAYFGNIVTGLPIRIQRSIG